MTIPTALSITGIDMVAWAARGISESLSLIDEAAQLRRTINGILVDLSQSGFRKFRASWSCDDLAAPAFDGIWPGAAITVDCIGESSYVTIGGTPARPVVPGSSRVEELFTFYRMRLAMRVVAYDLREDEWNAITGWSLEAEEI